MLCIICIICIICIKLYFVKNNTNRDKCAFITAIYSSYEKSCKPFVQQQLVDVDFICFTDIEIENTNGWIIDKTPYHIDNTSALDDGTFVNSLKNNQHPFNIAKYYKQQFHNIPRLKKYKYIVWIDGTISITNKYCAHETILYLQQHQLVTWSHEFRNGLLINEVNSSTGSDKYNKPFWNGFKQPIQNVKQQYDDYLKLGYDEQYWRKLRKPNPNYGVWITCFIGFNMNHIKTNYFLNEWYLHTLKYTTQDQVSFPFVLRLLKIHPLTLPNTNVNGKPHTKTDWYVKKAHGK